MDPRGFMGREYMGVSRSTFLVDKTGKIVKILKKSNPWATVRSVPGTQR